MEKPESEGEVNSRRLLPRVVEMFCIWMKAVVCEFDM